MNSPLQLSIVFPAFNEQDNIINSIDSVIHLKLSSFEIIIVDDGSTDKTAELVRQKQTHDSRIRLVQHGSNRGYGAALVSGFQQAKGQYIFFTDADQQFKLNELHELWNFRDHAEIVVGYRYPRQDPPHRKFNAWAWGRLVRVVTGIRVQDINCAFKLFHSDVLSDMKLESTGAFINSEFLAKAMSKGHKIIELPVTHYPRIAGEQTGAHPKVIIKAFWELLTLYRQI
jgi:glycosyltransferase involved in cell wall biosynthesis